MRDRSYQTGWLRNVVARLRRGPDLREGNHAPRGASIHHCRSQASKRDTAPCRHSARRGGLASHWWAAIPAGGMREATIGGIFPECPAPAPAWFSHSRDRLLHSRCVRAQRRAVARRECIGNQYPFQFRRPLQIRLPSAVRGTVARLRQPLSPQTRVFGYRSEAQVGFNVEIAS